MRLRPVVQRLHWTSLGNHVQNPVFVMGFTRSGKTLISNLLAEHPAIAAFPGEANNLWHPETHPWPYSRYRSELPPYWAGPSLHTAKSLELRYPRHGDHIRTVFGAFCWRNRGKTFLHESAKIAFLVPYILSLFPEARFINVLRDGRCAAYLEARKVSRGLGTNRWRFADYESGMQFEDVLAKCATSWQEHATEAQRLRTGNSPLRPTRFLDVRYEKFCDRPVAELLRICEFVGADPSAIPDPLPVQISNKNGEVEIGIEAGALRILDDVIGSMRAKCGYA